MNYFRLFTIALFSFLSSLYSYTNFVSLVPLSQGQMSSIQKLLNHPGLTESMRQKINHVLYKKYETMAYWKAYQFKRFHQRKCQYISVGELSLYSQMGLYKAIQKYNPEYPFYQFISLWIHNELCRGLTELHPLCAVTKSERIKRKDFFLVLHPNTTLAEKKALLGKRVLYKKRLETQFLGKDDWKLEKRQDLESQEIFLDNRWAKEELEEVWRRIHQMPWIQRRIFQLKYDFEFNKIRSNREVADLLGYSEEYVRKYLKKFQYLDKNE
jgi:RNA polymerase sigma factor (sigma-70 family)